MADPNAMATWPWGVFSTIDEENLPIPCAPNVPFEQVCVSPLLGNDVLQLPHIVFLGLDAEADRESPVSEVIENAGITSSRNLQDT